MSKHNNRSAFGDETTDPHAFARNHPIAPVFGIGVNSATGGDPLWSQTIHQCTARALTAALADALGIELHPAGTAARLSAERSQLLPPRRLRVPPVYRALHGELAVAQRALTTACDNLAELTCECRCPWLQAVQTSNDTLCEQVSTYPCTACETPHPAECWARWYTDRARAAMQSEREAATRGN